MAPYMQKEKRGHVREPLAWKNPPAISWPINCIPTAADTKLRFSLRYLCLVPYLVGGTGIEVPRQGLGMGLDVDAKMQYMYTQDMHNTIIRYT
jgi:hypothetical protein